MQAKKNPVSTPQSNPKVHIKAPKNDVIEPLYFFLLLYVYLSVYSLVCNLAVTFFTYLDMKMTWTYFIMTISFGSLLKNKLLKVQITLGQYFKTLNLVTYN